VFIENTEGTCYVCCSNSCRFFSLWVDAHCHQSACVQQCSLLFEPVVLAAQLVASPCVYMPSDNPHNLVLLLCFPLACHQVLDLSHCSSRRLPKSCWSRLTALTRLSLSGTDIRGSGRVPLHQLPSLAHLELRDQEHLIRPKALQGCTALQVSGWVLW
jgi:hypothetical protein